eukprot:6199686-Pleurochrysis_carterae.AAC.1
MAPAINELHSQGLHPAANILRCASLGTEEKVRFADSSRQPPVRRRKITTGTVVSSSAEGPNRFSVHNHTLKMLVADSAAAARKHLLPFAEMKTPPYNLLLAIAYGSFCDFAVTFRLRVPDEFHSFIFRNGGVYRLRFILVNAQFDPDGDGVIDGDELALYEKRADRAIAEMATFFSTLSVVAALLVGLTHYITLGYPLPFEASAETTANLGLQEADWLLWIAYATNNIAGGASFFTLCASIAARTCLTNVLKSRESKLSLLRTTNLAGILAFSMLLAS